jgi:hypothetical protein
LHASCVHEAAPCRVVAETLSFVLCTRGRACVIVLALAAHFADFKKSGKKKNRGTSFHKGKKGMIAVPANTITLGVSNPPLGLTTATTATTAPNETKEGMSTTTIIGIVLGALAFILLALFLFARKSGKTAG